MKHHILATLNGVTITVNEFEALTHYREATASLVSPYPRTPEILKDVPSSLNVNDHFYSDWDFTHYLNGFLGEILELCTVQFNSPEQDRLTFVIHEVVKELGDIMFYLSGIIRKIPRLYPAMVAINPHHKIEFSGPKSFDNLNDPIMFYGEKFANTVKRHLYYGDPQYSTDFSPYGIDALADQTLTVLRCLKVYGDATLGMVDVFNALPKEDGYDPQTIDNIRQSSRIIVEHPLLFAQPRGLIIVLDANRSKLAKRYPTGSFTLKDAIERKDME